MVMQGKKGGGERAKRRCGICDRTPLVLLAVAVLLAGAWLLGRAAG